MARSEGQWAVRVVSEQGSGRVRLEFWKDHPDCTHERIMVSGLQNHLSSGQTSAYGINPLMMDINAFSRFFVRLISALTIMAKSIHVESQSISTNTYS